MRFDVGLLRADASVEQLLLARELIFSDVQRRRGLSDFGAGLAELHVLEHRQNVALLHLVAGASLHLRDLTRDQRRDVRDLVRVRLHLGW